MVRSSAADSTRCGPEVRAPGERFTGSHPLLFDLLTRHEPLTARTDRGLSARSGARRRPRLMVRSCAIDSIRCGPKARAPEGRFRGNCPLLFDLLTRHEPLTARTDRGLSARSGASRRPRLMVRSRAADSIRCGPKARAPEGRFMGSCPFLFDLLTADEPADCSDGPRAFSPQRREPETTPDGSFVRRRFHPLRAKGPRSGGEVHGKLPVPFRPAHGRGTCGLLGRTAGFQPAAARAEDDDGWFVRAPPFPPAAGHRPALRGKGSREATRSFFTCSPDMNC